MIQSARADNGKIVAWKRWPFNGNSTWDSLFRNGGDYPHHQCCDHVGCHAMYTCKTKGSDASDTAGASDWDGIMKKGEGVPNHPNCIFTDINTESNNDISRLVTITHQSFGNHGCVSNRQGGFGTYIDDAKWGMDRGDDGPAGPCSNWGSGGACHWDQCAEPGTESPDCDGGYCGAHECESHQSDYTWNSRFLVR